MYYVMVLLISNELNKPLHIDTQKDVTSVFQKSCVFPSFLDHIFHIRHTGRNAAFIPHELAQNFLHTCPYVGISNNDSKRVYKALLVK